MPTVLQSNRIQAKLAIRIDTYIKLKGSLVKLGFNKANNNQKAAFFNTIKERIESNTLTISGLTQLINDLEDQQRRALFHQSLSAGPHTSSGSAKLVRELYKALGIELSHSSLRTLIQCSKQDRRTRSELSKHINNSLYEKWLKLPYTLTKKHLGHEIKARLGYLEKEAHEGRAHVELTASLLANSTVALDSLDTKKLQAQLLKVYKRFPEYTEALVDDLYRYSIIEDNAPKDLLDKLAALALEPCSGTAFNSANKTLRNALLNHPSVAYLAVKQQPGIFFQLNKSVQHSVQLELMHNRDEAEVLGQIEIEAKSLQEIKEDEQRCINYIYVEIGKEDNHATALLNKEVALEHIQNYLKTKPNTYKRDFFKKLSMTIEHDGLSIELLRTALQAESLNQKKLFHSRKGALKSKAAGCFFTLAELLLKDPLSEEDQKSIVEKKRLPSVEGRLTSQEEIIKKMIGEIRKNPKLAHHTQLGTHIYRALKNLENASAFLRRKKSHDNATSEAKKLRKLVKKTLKTAKEKPETIRFDPQGHILINPKTNSEAIYYNIDIVGHPTLGALFKKTLKDYSDPPSKQIPSQDQLDVMITKFLESDQRGSIIPLQEEAEMHMRQLSRVLEACSSSEISSDQWAEIRLQTSKEINKQTLHHFRIALFKACRTPRGTIGELNVSTLNYELDKARKPISKLCKIELVKAISDNKIGIGKEAFAKLYHETLKDMLSQEKLEATTATGSRYLRTNNRNQTLTVISPTEETAHKRKEKPAFRMLDQYHYVMDENGKVSVIPLKQQRAEGRTPAMPIVKTSHGAAVKDVATNISKHYRQLQTKVGGHTGHMTYNLLISFQGKFYDAFTFGLWTPPGRKNRERLKAARTVKGIHRFNKAQVDAGQIDSLCYLQHIAINQHGEVPKYGNFDNLHHEALLMSDIALLATLTEYAHYLPAVLRKTIPQNYQTTHQAYIDFLSENPQGDRCFSDSKKGEALIKHLESTKQDLGKAYQTLSTTDCHSLEALVTRALAKLIITKTKHPTANQHTYVHRDPRFGTLIQSLSVFLETLSQSGCKSANERYQMVSNRVELLRSMESKDEKFYSKKEQALVKALKNIITKEHPDVNELQCCLDRAYNKHNQQGSATATSAEDQGGPSKVEATKSSAGYVTEVRSNVAESHEVSNLHSEHAYKMQAHKGNHIGELHSVIQRELKEELAQYRSVCFSYFFS